MSVLSTTRENGQRKSTLEGALMIEKIFERSGRAVERCSTLQQAGGLTVLQRATSRAVGEGLLGARRG